MKFNISKKEYLSLLDMLYISDWVMHGHDIEDNNNAYKTLRKKILSFFKEMGADDRIEYSKEDDDYYELTPFDSSIHTKFIDPYDDQSFWEELIDRLGERDAVAQVGVDRFQKMDYLERAEILSETTKCYADEFNEHGLDYLKITHEKSKAN